MKKIEKLTLEQESQLAAYRDKWLKIGLSCEPADRAAAVAGAASRTEIPAKAL